MARRRKPPLTQAQRTELDRQKDARKAEVERLRAQGLQVNCDAAWNIIVTRRLDVFALLHERKSLTDGQLYAARRLDGLIALAYGHERAEQSLDRVDRSSQGAPGQNITQAMIDAARELRDILTLTGPVNARLLMALMAPKEAILTRWRDTVARETGETNPDVMGALVRAACENLALAWPEAERRAMERRRVGRQLRERAA